MTVDVDSGVACSTMVGGNDAIYLQVCLTDFGGGPAGDLSLWAAALWCGSTMVFWRWLQ